MEKYNLIATATFGLEAIVANELREMGFENLVVENSRVLFRGTKKDIVRTNMHLRTADRVFIQMASFKATSFEELFNQMNALPWEQFLPVDAEFPVIAKSVRSKLFSLSDIQKISKKAIVKRLSSAYHVDWFKEDGALFRIVVSILKDNVTVSIDTSGDGLHKRGYREKGYKAPLKETLAAALVLISKWKPHIALIDPMCGTGTIPIEAALIGRNIAPGLNRKFAFQEWPLIPKELYLEVKKEAYAMADFEKELRIEAYDKDYYALKIARENAELAGVIDDIHFQERDIRELHSKKKYGYIISNPPYGERLNELEEVIELTRIMKERFELLDTWSKYIFTAFEDFEKYFKKATKNRKLYNGRIKCYYYQYYGPKPPRKRVLNEKKESE